MPIVDRSILRLATYEMMYVEDVPTSVSINEAVELAKDFGGEDESPRFVNGVLGRIAKRLDGVEDAAGGSAGEPAEEEPSSKASATVPADAEAVPAPVFEAPVEEVAAPCVASEASNA